MKRITPILMIIMILIGTFNDGVVYITFQLNQDYIAQFLCVEKDIPESTCNGKCLLSKTIIDNHVASENSSIPFLTESKEQVLYLFLDQLKCSDAPVTFLKKKTLMAHQRMIDRSYVFDVFHPPQV